MFDTITCQFPLPGDPPTFVLGANHEFQTKDFNNRMDHYVITGDRRLRRVRDADVILDDFDGDIEFYSSNLWGASAKRIPFTEKGEDFIFVAYLARFTHGRLEWVREVRREQEAARPITEFEEYCRKERGDH